MVWILGGYVWLYLHRPFEVWSFLGTLQIERLYALGMIAFWLVNPQKRWVHNRLNVAFMMLAFAIVTCWASSPYPQHLGEKVWDDFCKIGVVYVILITSIRDRRALRTVLVLYLAALMIYQLHSLLEYVNGRHEYRMNVARMTGVDKTFGDPNTFAASLYHALPFVAPFWLMSKGHNSRAGVISFVLSTMTCIFLTGSRRAFAGICLLVVLMAVRSRHRVMLFFLLILSAPVVWGVLREDLQNRFLTLVDSSYGPANARESGMSRYYFFLDSLELWNRSPVTGVGPGCFGAGAGHGMQPHNLFAQVIGELGTLGMLALGFIVHGFYKNGREIERAYAQRPHWQKDFTYYVARSTWIAVVLLLFMGLGGHNLYRYNWLWFGAFQVVAVQLTKERAAREAPGASFTR